MGLISYFYDCDPLHTFASRVHAVSMEPIGIIDYGNLSCYFMIRNTNSLPGVNELPMAKSKIDRYSMRFYNYTPRPYARLEPKAWKSRELIPSVLNLA